MSSKQVLLITILGMSLLMNSGCVAVLVGGAAAGTAGAVLYVKEELHSTEDVSLDRVWNAT